MKEIFADYFSFFLHPVKSCQEVLEGKRQLQLSHLIAASWIFMLLSLVISTFTTAFMKSYLTGAKFETRELIIVIVQAIFWPLIAWIGYKTNYFSNFLTLKLTKAEQPSFELKRQASIVNLHSLPFAIFPIVGNIANIFYDIIALKHILKFNTVQIILKVTLSIAFVIIPILLIPIALLGFVNLWL